MKRGFFVFMTPVAKATKSVSTFINPSGLIEQHYLGDQDGETVAAGVNEADSFVKRQMSVNERPLLLVDLSRVTSTDIDSHIAAVKGMKEVAYERISVYGPPRMQMLINTLAFVAGKSDSVHAFRNRSEAIKWLKRE